MRTRALEMDVRHDYQAQRFVAQARERGPIRLDRDEIADTCSGSSHLCS